MKIMCIKNQKLPENITKQTKSFCDVIENYIKETDIEWIERPLAEKDFNYKQIIPYVVINNSDGKIACYRRHGSEKRLTELYSCGFGGHIEECDKGENVMQTIKKGMLRELSEEISNFDEEKMSINYKGFIHEKESEVGLVHIGVVFEVKCEVDFLPQESEETKGLEWKTQEELRELKTELWSKLALELV